MSSSNMATAAGRSVKVVIDRDLCESNGLCVEVCPDVFRIDAQDRLVLLMERPDERARARVEHAVQVCPRQALRIDED